MKTYVFCSINGVTPIQARTLLTACDIFKGDYWDEYVYNIIIEKDEE